MVSVAPTFARDLARRITETAAMDGRLIGDREFIRRLSRSDITTTRARGTDDVMTTYDSPAFITRVTSRSAAFTEVFFADPDDRKIKLMDTAAHYMMESVDDLLVIVAYQLRDPGNLGTIIRTADAVGATGVVIVEPSVDLYDPQAIRATMGSLFALPIVRLADETLLPRWADDVRSAGLPLHVVASSARAAQLHYEADYRRPLVLLVGSERHGLPQPMRDSADLRVRLPMAGRATSLNVAAATAALVYEIVRQRAVPAEPGSSPQP